MTRNDRLFVFLVVAFATVSVGFLGSAAYTEVRAASIDDEIEKMETNSLPSVQHLASARAALRHLDVGAVEYANGAAGEREGARRVMTEARTLLARQVAGADSTPDYPGEKELRLAEERALASLDEALAGLASPGEGGANAAYSTVHARIDATDEALTERMDLNSAYARSEVATVAKLRRQATWLALGLGALCSALALAAGLLALRAVGKWRDLERANAEALLERANELDMFAKRVAHDLLNPLAALSFTLGSIRRASGGSEAIAALMVRAEGCLKRARKLVTSALEFARSGGASTAGARADLGEAVDGVVEESRRDERDERDAQEGKGKAEIVVESLSGAPPLACDPGVLSSVLSNLVRNALKYMGDSPVKRVTIRAREVGEGDDGRVRVEVEDTGPGLPAGFAARAFDPYTRAPDSGQPGLGLGLATVRRFVTSYGGKVGVESEEGRGCLFWFELPAAGAAAPAPSEDEAPATSQELAR